jgi:transposase
MMSGKPIDMSKIRNVIKLYTQGKSKVFISDYLKLSRNTVKKYIKQFISSKKTFEELSALSDLELESLFSGQNTPDLSPKLATLYSFFPTVEKQLKKVGMTRELLWLDYKSKHPDGYQLSYFCELYLRWSQRTNIKSTMHIDHKAGDKMYIDYAGQKLNIIDKESGEIIEVEFFVAILGASQMTYAEASFSQKKADFIHSVENALYFFGGVPQAIVPDNLKSAVVKSDRFEPKINETFMHFSEHYATTILPARAYRPKDKSLVEGAVKILYTRVYSHLKSKHFFSLPDLNKEIWILLEKHNTSILTGKSFSRKELFIELEKHELSPLPQERFELRRQSIVTVLNNGHAFLSEDKHHYSVPYFYIGKRVKLLYTETSVEIFLSHNRIAFHPRVKSPYNYSTIKEHMASSHQFMTDWNPQRFISWAESIDKYVKEFICLILDKKQHPEQSYKSCLGILSLEKKYTRKRLINACTMALEFGVYNYKIVQNILEKEMDMYQINTEEKETPEMPDHQNIRGENYYK